MVEKREFLVGYEYGMGGVWGIMNARSKEEIASIYPELVVVDEPPSWMTPDRLERLREQEWHDIDGAPWGILNGIIADRQPPKDEGCADS
jgi:hypothetical protein